ncbi:substrate-binding domain-containing protein [Diplocloster hominis]|uniref:substrate-binding domain-containing protein n=1 Tax=Diplocloster hominis TaxID=3079010 RepID=UPI003CCFA366
MLDPPLSTMRVSKEALGKAAVALLDRQLYKKPENHIKIEISTELVERNSVKKLANNSRKPI